MNIYIYIYISKGAKSNNKLFFVLVFRKTSDVDELVCWLSSKNDMIDYKVDIYRLIIPRTIQDVDYYLIDILLEVTTEIIINI